MVKNSLGNDGNIMKCFICNSNEHLKNCSEIHQNRKNCRKKKREQTIMTFCINDHKEFEYGDLEAIVDT